MSQITINTNELRQVGDNLQATVQDGKLILVIDTSMDLGPSSSGKMIGIASTGGFQAFPSGLKGNVYIGKKRQDHPGQSGGFPPLCQDKRYDQKSNYFTDRYLFGRDFHQHSR
jgi:hypothetical protein